MAGESNQVSDVQVQEQQNVATGSKRSVEIMDIGNIIFKCFFF